VEIREDLCSLGELVESEVETQIRAFGLLPPNCKMVRGDFIGNPEVSEFVANKAHLVFSNNYAFMQDEGLQKRKGQKKGIFRLYLPFKCVNPL
jgi:hypothetical protein